MEPQHRPSHVGSARREVLAYIAVLLAVLLACGGGSGAEDGGAGASCKLVLDNGLDGGASAGFDGGTPVGLAAYGDSFCGASLLGMHGPWKDTELSDIKQMFGGGGGWLVDLVYSTDTNWNTDAKWGAAVDAGFTVVLRLDYARHSGGATIPPLTTPDGGLTQCLNGGDGLPHANGTTHLACYLDGIRQTVQAQGKVHAWIIGNEPNITDEAGLFKDTKIDPGDFAQVYLDARNTIHGVTGHEGDVVFLGGVSPGAADKGVRYAAGDQFLEAMLADLKACNAPVDGITVHAYGGNATSATPQVFRTQGDSSGWQDQVQIIEKAGFQSSIVLVSEFNVRYDPTTMPASAPSGAAFITQAAKDIQGWNDKPGNTPIAGAVWYTWSSDTNAGGDPQLSMQSWWNATTASTGQTPANNWALAFQAVAPQVNAAFPRIGALRETVTIDGSTPWSDTALPVRANDTVTATCQGAIYSWGGSTPWTCTGEAPTTWDMSQAPLCPGFSLIGRIGQNGTSPECFVPEGGISDGGITDGGASAPMSFKAPRSGCLWLGFNDGVNFGDNSGQWTVQVEVK